MFNVSTVSNTFNQTQFPFSYTKSNQEKQRLLFAIKSLQNGIPRKEQLARLQELGVTPLELKELSDSKRSLKGGMHHGSLDIDVDLISQRLMQAEQAVLPATGQKIVVVIGNTGAGKSVFVNHMYDRRMGLISGDKIEVIVDGLTQPITPIGHEGSSLTHFPVIPKDERVGDLVFADCPGFFDNRGVEFDIPNSYAINQMIEQAGSIQAVVILVPFHSFDAERGRGFQRLEDLLKQIFKKDIEKYQSNIIYLVTKCTGRDTPSGEDIDIESMREMVRGVTANADGQAIELPEGAKSPIQKMDRRFFLYDPLEQLDEGVTKRQLLEMISGCNGIKKTAFQTFLSEDSLESIIDYLDHNKETIVRCFESNSFREMAQALDLTRKCEIIPRAHAGKHYADQINYIQGKLELLAKGQPDPRVVVTLLDEGRYQITLCPFSDSSLSGSAQTYSFEVNAVEKIESYLEQYFQSTQNYQTMISLKQALEGKSLIEMFDFQSIDRLFYQHIQKVASKINLERNHEKAKQDTLLEKQQLEEETIRHQRERQQDIFNRQQELEKLKHENADEIEILKRQNELLVKEKEDVLAKEKEEQAAELIREKERTEQMRYEVEQERIRQQRAIQQAWLLQQLQLEQAEIEQQRELKAARKEQRRLEKQALKAEKSKIDARGLDKQVATMAKRALQGDL